MFQSVEAGMNMNSHIVTWQDFFSGLGFKNNVICLSLKSEAQRQSLS